MGENPPTGFSPPVIILRKDRKGKAEGSIQAEGSMAEGSMQAVGKDRSSMDPNSYSL